MGAPGVPGAGRGEEGGDGDVGCRRRGGAGEELPLFVPTPSFMASADEV